MEPRRLLLPLILVLVLAATLIWLWHGEGFPQRSAFTLPKGLESTVLPRPKGLPEFQLTDLAGRPFGPAELQGHWTFVFFGYTRCPDVCPTTLYTLRQVHKQLLQTPQYLADTRFLFVTLDPERDTPEILRGYVQHFDPDFLGARGDKATLDRLTSELGVPYVIERQAGNSDDYVVDHSTTILLIDPQGRYYARFFTTSSPAAMTDAYRRTRDFYNR